MSLINDMLKNLERRREQVQQTWAHQSLELQEEESIFFKAFIAAILIVLLALLIFGLYRLYLHHTEKKTTSLVATAIANNAPPAKMQIMAKNTSSSEQQQKLPPPPKLASAIHINDLAKQTEITIDLNATPTYLTTTDSNASTVTLSLENTYLDIPKICAQLGAKASCLLNNMIPLPINGTALSSVHLDQNDGQSLALTFKLAPNASLQSTNLLLNPTSLKLTFAKQTPAAPAMTNKSPDSVDISSSEAPAMTPSPSPGVDSITEPLAVGGDPANINAGPTDQESKMLQPVSNTEPVGPFTEINDQLIQKHFDNAQRLIDALPKEKRNSENGIIAQAKVYIGKGDNREALQLLEKNTPTRPSPDYSAIYAASLEFNGKHAEAVAQYKKLVNYWPDNPNWWLGLAIAGMNNREEALAQYAFHHLLSFNDLNPEIQQYTQDRLEELNIDAHAHQTN